MGYDVVQQSRFLELRKKYGDKNVFFGGPHAAFFFWKHLFYYGKEKNKFFDIGGGVEYLPFVMSVNHNMGNGLSFLCLRFGARHHMYFIPFKGFQQAVYLGMAAPLTRLEPEIKIINPMIGGYFGYYHDINKHIAIGAKWNWNFVFLVKSNYKHVYTHSFDIGIHFKILRDERGNSTSAVIRD